MKMDLLIVYLVNELEELIKESLELINLDNTCVIYVKVDRCCNIVLITVPIALILTYFVQ